MRIQEIRVNRYGPLADIPSINPGDFTLIFGENESGKTLLLDAILRFLLSKKRERELFSRLDRVEHDPDGFVEILHEGQVFRFPDQGSLPDLLGIHAADLRNVLVVRAGDLQVHKGEDKSYYAEITDRLTGIHREPIKKIKEKLQSIGKLTSSGKLSDAQGYDKIASRVEDAKRTLLRIDDLNIQMAETDMVALEAELLDAVEKRAEVNEALELLQVAQKREQYESGMKLLEELEQCAKGVEKLPAIEQAHYDAWRDAENTIKKTGEALQDAEGVLAESKEELKAAQVELETAGDHQGELQRRKFAMDDLEKRADQYRENVEAAASRSPVLDLMPRFAVALALLLGVTFIAILVGVLGNFFTVAALILGGILAIAGVTLVVDRALEGRRRKVWESLRLDAARVGIKVENFKELLASIGGFAGELDRAQERLTRAETQTGIASNQLESQKELIKKYRDEIDKAKESLSELKEDSGLASFEDLEAARAKLQRLKDRQIDLLAKLGAQFGEAEEQEESIEVWRAQIQEIAEFEGAAPGVEYDKAREAKSDEEFTELQNMIAELEEQLDGIRKEIGEIASEASRILATDVQLPGDTIEDLVMVVSQLHPFVDGVEEQAELARMAIEIFNEIQKEEEQKVKGLFGKDDLASQYFRSTTAGAYDRVEYDPELGELNVVRPNGEALRAYALSSGTYDQLYLATRLSLAQRLLQGETGFLLLDDAFLTSDSKRLPRQLEILLELAEAGWQVVYFSVKDEIHKGLRKSIKDGRVGLVELPSIHL